MALGTDDGAPLGADELDALRDFAAAVHTWRVSLAARHGLTLNDTVVLTTLLDLVQDITDEGPAVLTTAADLAHAVDVASGRLTGALDRLEAAGLARRARNPTDRRSVLVAPTERGRQAGADLEHALRAIVADAPDASFREHFTRRLRRLSAAVHEVCGRLDRRP